MIIQRNSFMGFRMIKHQVSPQKINLMGTVTTDITNGIQGLTVDNFIF